MELPFETESYLEANSMWPSKGKHILATFTPDSILVFQAYKPSIAEWVEANQTFINCPGFSTERMTWIKPNFLWMMYRSGWANKVNQERILAISVKREGFEELLKKCRRNGKDLSSNEEAVVDDVRLQWDPDHDPFGEKVERRAIQLGIRGKTLKKYLEEWIISVKDITQFVQEQYVSVQRNQLDTLMVPVQRIYSVSDETIKQNLNLDGDQDQR